MKYIIPALSLLSLLSCASSRFISRSAKQLTEGKDFKNAHLGISIYDVAARKNLYSYQAEKYFTPASNTKLFTLYAGLKYLKDSLPGLRYTETTDTLYIIPTGDPTLLHPDFKNQPVIERLQKTSKPIVITKPEEAVSPFGMGWSWDDYNSSYMAERSALPVYGNVIRWTQSAQSNSQEELGGSTQTFVFSEPDVNWKVRFIEDTSNISFRVIRKKEENYFEIHQGKESLSIQSVPFITNGIQSALELLKDTIHHEIITGDKKSLNYQTLYSQATDSLYRPMMHESDNFFAEQVLLMSASEHLNTMSEEKMIDYLLKNNLKQLPQSPRWVDGSGLSRYNLFTPSDFVWLLNKMAEEFSLERLKIILPTSGEGTLEGYYSAYKGHIYAKTGTLSATLALSGFLITKKNRLLIFSILVNNHQASASSIRRQVESFISNIINKY
jgi:serine-type D-Ala-D-Ala carboxypeptidase/endopeptidase (penicillin-binding protein 4)